MLRIKKEKKTNNLCFCQRGTRNYSNLLFTYYVHYEGKAKNVGPCWQQKPTSPIEQTRNEK